MTHLSRRTTSLELNLDVLLAGPFEPHTLRSPWQLIGGSAQMIVPVHLWRFPHIAYRHEHWDTPDHDFIDPGWTIHETDAHAPPAVMLRSLESDSRSHYAWLLMDALCGRHWLGVTPHFRGYPDETSLAPRVYHCGDGAEIAWTLKRLY